MAVRRRRVGGRPALAARAADGGFPTSQVIFGTDFPYRTAVDHVKGLAAYGFSASDLRAIEPDNAAKLLPRLGA